MASIRQRADKWQARVTRKGYPAEVRSFATRGEAARWAKQTEAAMDLGVHRHHGPDSEVTLRDLLERYALQVSPSKRGYRDEVIRIRAMQRSKMAGFSLANLSPSVVAAFRDERLQRVKAGAVIRDLSLLSSVINHARREWGLAVENPCERVKKPATPEGRSRILDAAERVRLLDALEPLGRRSPLLLPLVKLALATAMRRGELLGLEWAHISLERQVAFLPTTKNGRSRHVPLSREALAVLSALPRTEGVAKVFPVSACAAEAAFKRACERAGLEDFRFHDLRHSATTALADKLPNIMDLAAVTGHRSLRMLQRYYHPDASDLARKLR